MKKHNNISEHASLGLNMVAGMVFFSFIGYYIDQKRGDGEIFTLIGMFLGLFYCLYEVWKLIKNTDNNST